MLHILHELQFHVFTTRGSISLISMFAIKSLFPPSKKNCQWQMVLNYTSKWLDKMDKIRTTE